MAVNMIADFWFGDSLVPELLRKYSDTTECEDYNPIFCVDPARVIVASAVCHWLMFAGCFVVFPLVASYRKLDFGKKVYWNSCVVTLCSIVANVHAILAAAAAIAWFSDFSEQRELLERSAFINTATAWTCGYFVYDVIVMALGALIDPDFRSTAMFIHHVVGFVALSLSCNFKAAYIPASALLFEASTPFVNSRWLLVAAGYRFSPIYTINGLFIVATFFFFRIVYGFFGFWYITYNIADEISVRLPIFAQLLLFSACLVASALNMFWFKKIAVGGYKVLFGSKKAAKTE